MNNSTNDPRPHRFKAYAGILFVVWTCCIGGSFAWNIDQQRNTMLSLARMEADLTLRKDMLYWKWVSSKKGAYVLVSEADPPNPYLKGPDRDITTREGGTLTLMNPAYMTRQVNEMAHKEGIWHGHITSLNPIRPENHPDPWETEVLIAFEKGLGGDVSSMQSLSGEPYFRLMRPFVVEERCLQCHGDQGYKAGDIMGGMSASIAMKPLYAVESGIRRRLLFAHSLIWILGIGGIAFAATRLATRIAQIRCSEQDAKRERDTAQSYLDIAGVMILVLDTDANVILVNKKGCEILGYEERDIVGKEWFEHFLPERVRDQVKGVFNSIISGQMEKDEYVRSKVLTRTGEERLIAWDRMVLKDNDGTIIGTLSSGADITERARAEADRVKLIHELREALSRVRRLSGLLPICASCKKVRQDDGYWTQIEAYLREHSDAEFTHGICPECEATLYPGASEEEHGNEDATHG